VQRGVAVVAAPRELDAKLSDAAAPTVTPAAVIATVAAIRRRMLIGLSMALRRGREPRGTPRPVRSRYPLITTLTAVTDAADTTGEKVTTIVVPEAGVVPVASPSDAPAVVDRVTLYGLL